MCMKTTRLYENIIREHLGLYRQMVFLSDPGKRAETLVACHLLKAVECWTDLGFGDFDLFYVRDRKKREVDFLVTKD